MSQSLLRKTGSAGGVGLHISNQHDFKHRENANLESIWIEIFPQKSKRFWFALSIDPLKTRNIYMKTSQNFLMICCQ